MQPTDPDVVAIATAKGITPAAAITFLRTQAAQSEQADRLLAELGPTRTGGAYFDATGRIVVAVTDEAAATRVRGTGTLARLVTRSSADLERVLAALDVERGVPNTAWGVDEAANQVVLTLPETQPTDPVAKSKLVKVEDTGRSFGAAVRIERRPGTLRTTSDVAGGDPIYPNVGAACSAGFTTSNGINNFVLTAGHCLRENQLWDNWVNHDLGPSDWWYFPNEDDGLIRIATAVYPLGGIWLHNGTVRSVHGWAYAKRNQWVCKSGRITQVTCGQVKAVNQTANYDSGFTVYGLDKVNLCLKSGDSGSSLFDGNTALGVASGGWTGGNLQCGGPQSEAYFYPVANSLNWYKVWLIGGP